MAFYQRNTLFDLSELNIENIFISDFMPSASGTYVKVYLLGLMFARSQDESFRMDNRALANMLSLPLQDVVEAWLYWQKQGIVTCQAHENSDDFDVQFHSLRELYIKNNFQTKGTLNKPSEKVQSHSLTEQKKTFKRIYTDIEKIIGTPLSHNDYRHIGDFYNNYYPDVDVLKFAFEWCYNTRNMRSVKAVQATLSSWLKGNLMTLNEIKNHVELNDTRYEVYKEVLKSLGLSFRLPTKAERDAIDTWLDDYAFSSEEMLKFIVVFSKKTSNLNINYLSKAFASLHQSGIKTTEAYESSLPQVDSRRTPSQEKRKKLTIEKERTYTEEELESLLLKKNNT